MRKSLKQTVVDCKLPMYMRDILCNGYCPSFLNMTIVSDGGRLSLYYETGARTKLNIGRLSSADKMELILTIMTMNFENEEWLISAKFYLLEPELIYSLGDRVEHGTIKLLYYPDIMERSFDIKICSFADKLFKESCTDEKQIIEQFKRHVIEGDNYMARRVLEKNIDRLKLAKVV